MPPVAVSGFFKAPQEPVDLKALIGRVGSHSNRAEHPGSGRAVYSAGAEVGILIAIRTPSRGSITTPQKTVSSP